MGEGYPVVSFPDGVTVWDRGSKDSRSQPPKPTGPSISLLPLVRSPSTGGPVPVVVPLCIRVGTPPFPVDLPHQELLPPLLLPRTDQPVSDLSGTLHSVYPRPRSVPVSPVFPRCGPRETPLYQLPLRPPHGALNVRAKGSHWHVNASGPHSERGRKGVLSRGKRQYPSLCHHLRFPVAQAPADMGTP